MPKITKIHVTWIPLTSLGRRYRENTRSQWLRQSWQCTVQIFFHGRTCQEEHSYLTACPAVFLLRLSLLGLLPANSCQWAAPAILLPNMWFIQRLPSSQRKPSRLFQSCTVVWSPPYPILFSSTFLSQESDLHWSLKALLPPLLLPSLFFPSVSSNKSLVWLISSLCVLLRGNALT